MNLFSSIVFVSLVFIFAFIIVLNFQTWKLRTLIRRQARLKKQLQRVNDEIESLHSVYTDNNNDQRGELRKELLKKRELLSEKKELHKTLKKIK